MHSHGSKITCRCIHVLTSLYTCVYVCVYSKMSLSNLCSPSAQICTTNVTTIINCLFIFISTNISFFKFKLTPVHILIFQPFNPKGTIYCCVPVDCQGKDSGSEPPGFNRNISNCLEVRPIKEFQRKDCCPTLFRIIDTCY